MQNCILAGFGRDQSWHSSNKLMSNVTVANVEYKTCRIVDTCAKQAERLWKQYLSINSKNCNSARFYRVQSWHSTNRLIWHQMWNIRRIVWPTFLHNRRRYLDSNMQALISKTAVTLDFTESSLDNVQTVWCVLYLAANVEYNMHPIVNILTMKTEIHSLEYLGLNVQNYKYAGFDSCRI